MPIKINQFIQYKKTETQNGEKTIDLKYAYSQIQLHDEAPKHYNFSFICGE